MRLCSGQIYHLRAQSALQSKRFYTSHYFTQKREVYGPIQASSEAKPISYDMLWDAATHEYRAMGHIIRDDDRNDDRNDYEIPDYRYER